MVDPARQLPEIEEFFNKWYPPYAKLATHAYIMNLVEQGDEDSLTDYLYRASWEKIKHKLSAVQRVEFKRDFDQMLDALFPGRSRERAQEVRDYPILAKLRKKAEMDFGELLSLIVQTDKGSTTLNEIDRFIQLTEPHTREQIKEDLADYLVEKFEFWINDGLEKGFRVEPLTAENWEEEFDEYIAEDQILNGTPFVGKMMERLSKKYGGKPIRERLTDQELRDTPSAEELNWLFDQPSKDRDIDARRRWRSIMKQALLKRAYKVPVCPICGKYMMEIDRWDDDDDEGDLILFHCQTPSCIALQDQDEDKWAENCQASVTDDGKGPDYGEDEDVKYYDPINPKRVFEPQYSPYMPGEKTPAERKKEIDEAYHLLHGRLKSKALRAKRIRLRKILAEQHQTACVWCPELRPNEQPNMIKVGMEGSHGICPECLQIMTSKIES